GKFKRDITPHTGLHATRKQPCADIGLPVLHLNNCHQANNNQAKQNLDRRRIMFSSDRHHGAGAAKDQSADRGKGTYISPHQLEQSFIIDAEIEHIANFQFD
ncbi:MAG: hypothetical protein IPL18_13590, partial [Sphingomonadales bacterium]|nr:hypothetical protein [Sphingomonadales bacterium]